MHGDSAAEVGLFGHDDGSGVEFPQRTTGLGREVGRDGKIMLLRIVAEAGGWRVQ